MRTKILLSAALLAAGLATSVAQQVYSVNAVGYVNVTLQNGYNLIANPLNGTNNQIGTILPSVPDFSAVLKWNSAGQQFNQAETFFGGTWFDGNFLASTTVFNPGEGFFFQNQSGGAITATFVGEVPQGSLTNTIGANYGFYSSQVPQSGDLPSLGFPGVDFMSFNAWSTGSQAYNQAYTYFGGQWFDPAFQPNAPSVAVAEGFLITNPGGPVEWNRTFSVNN